jgi:hypothetical protein
VVTREYKIDNFNNYSALFSSIPGDPSEIRIDYSCTTLVNGIPSPGVGVSFFNLPGNSGKLSPLSFNFKLMWPGANAFEAGVSGLNWDIFAPDLSGRLYHKFVEFPDIYVQFPKKIWSGLQYNEIYADIITAEAMNDAIKVLNLRLELGGALNLQEMPNETIVAAFMETTTFFISALTWESGAGVVSLSFHGQNTAVTPALWRRWELAYF